MSLPNYIWGLSYTDLIGTIQALAASISAIAIIVAIKQLRAASIQARAPVTYEQLSQFRSPEFVSARDYIKTELKEELRQLGMPSDTPLDKLPQRTPLSPRYVSHFLDHLGALVKNGYADEKVITGFIGGEIEKLWQHLAPHIHAQRIDPQYGAWPYYQLNFEWLAKRCGAKGQNEYLKQLKSEI